MKDDTLFLIHIRECIARVENYVPFGPEESLTGLPDLKQAVEGMLGGE